MNIEKFAQMKALEAAYITGNSALIDHVLNGPQGDEARETFKLKRLQFDTVPQLYEEVENVCALLGCSKREFLELAVSQAVIDAQKTFSETYHATAGHEFGEVEAC